jgi:peptidoglycan/xylan/chitin deacetylase (PgdA/CDA1 family)
MKLRSLMYHDIVAPGHDDSSGFPGAAAARYKLDTNAFAQHLGTLAGSGLRFASVNSAAASSEARCLLTFDDGGASAVEIAAALAAHGMTGHFFVVTERIGQPGFVTADDLRMLRAAGHVVGSHSHTHPAEISRLGAAALAAEWQQSVDRLRQCLGEPILVASVPGGFYSRPVALAAAAAGIRYLFTSEPTARTHQVDGCLVLGRYALWRGMGPQRALALARGQGLACRWQWLIWNSKKPLKRWARPLYRSLRNRWLGRA